MQHRYTQANKKMKIWDLIMPAFVLSIFAIAISGHILGQDKYDFNWWIAILIYSIPAILLSIINGLILVKIQKLVKNNYLRIALGIIPTIILIGFLFISSDFIEFIAIFGIIPIFLTYLIWIRKFLIADRLACV